MKKTGFIVLLSIIILAGIFYFGSNAAGKTTVGKEGYGFAQMRGNWDLFVDGAGTPSIVYISQSDSILELGVFPVPQKNEAKQQDPESKTENSASNTTEVGSGIKTRGDVTEYVEGFLKKLGKGENLRSSKGTFLHYESNIITSEYTDPNLDNRHFFVKAWIFTDEKGSNRFIILESDDTHYALDEKDLTESFHF